MLYNFAITFTNWESMNAPCVNEHSLTNTPKLILFVIILTTSVFFFYQAYYKQQWDIEIKIEYTVNIIGLVLC